MCNISFFCATFISTNNCLCPENTACVYGFWFFNRKSQKRSPRPCAGLTDDNPCLLEPFTLQKCMSNQPMNILPQGQTTYMPFQILLKLKYLKQVATDPILRKTRLCAFVLCLAVFMLSCARMPSSRRPTSVASRDFMVLYRFSLTCAKC
jgi:hypothetical protein